MSQDGRYAGLDLWLAWYPNSGGAYIVSGDFRSFSYEQSTDDIDASAGNDEYRYHLPSLKDHTASLEVLDSGGTTHTSYGMSNGESGTLYWGPKGSASGSPLHGIECYISSLSTEYPYDDVVSISVEFQGRGSMVSNWAGTFA